MAGHIIAAYLEEAGHAVTGFARKPSAFLQHVILGDVKNTALLEQSVRDGAYDAIVNCVGILNESAERDKSNAVFINAYIPHFLSELVNRVGSHLIHLSTDCVFSGSRGQYTEEDFRDGATFYDRSKALGEVEAPRCITLRNSIIGPDINPGGIGLMNWFLQRQEGVGGYLNAIWTGQTTLQLAKTVEAAALARAEGLYNMVPDESISKYDLLLLMNRYLRKTPVEVRPVDNPRVDKSLRRTRFGFSYVIPGYEDMLRDLKAYMDSHRAMYPHYR